MGSSSFPSLIPKNHYHGTQLFFATFQAAILLALISAVIALALNHRRRIALERRLLNRRTQEAQVKLAIDSLMELLRIIIDAALLSNCRPELLVRDLQSRLSKTIGDEGSLVKDCLLFANVRFNGLADYLERHFPLLNREEILLCCCYCLGLPTDNLRYLLKHENNNSLYNRNGRIRKKLGLTNQRVTIDDFLYELTLQLEKERVEREYFELRKK